MSNIYITGIAGFLGSHLAKHLTMKGHKVKGCDNLIGGYKDNIPESIDCAFIDILENDKLALHMKDVDVVIHTAAYAYEGLSVFSPKLVMENIYSGTVSVASAAIQNNVKFFINCSSMARYGNAGTPPFFEDMECKPQDPYGLAKLHAEQALNHLGDIHNMIINHVVPHNIIGTNQKYDDPYRNVVSIFINRLLQGKNIIIYGDGSQKRSFSYVMDCIDPIIQVVERPLAHKDVINIGPHNNEVDIKTLAYMVADSCQIYPAIKYLPSRPQEVDHAWCSSNKAKTLLNYNPGGTSLKQTINEMTNWIRNRGTKPFQYHLPVEIITDKTPKTWTEKLY